MITTPVLGSRKDAEKLISFGKEWFDREPVIWWENQRFAQMISDFLKESAIYSNQHSFYERQEQLSRNLMREMLICSKNQRIVQRIRDLLKESLIWWENQQFAQRQTDLLKESAICSENQCFAQRISNLLKESAMCSNKHSFDEVLEQPSRTALEQSDGFSEDSDRKVGR